MMKTPLSAAIVDRDGDDDDDDDDGSIIDHGLLITVLHHLG